MTNKTELPEKIIMGSRAEEIVLCAKCGKELKVEDRTAFLGDDGQDIYFCSDCLAKINTDLQNETKNPNIIGALLLGIAAAITGGICWFLLTVFLEKSIGYIAIGVGWLIGYAVCLGAGNKKGLPLQILSAVLTTFALIISDFAIYLHLVAKDPEINTSATNLLIYLVITGKIPLAVVDFVQSMISPIGLLIWGIGIWFAYSIPKASKL